MPKRRQVESERKKFAVPIRWKLLGSTVFVAVVAVAIALIGLQRMNVLNERLNQIVDVAAERVKLASLMRQDLLTVTRAEKNMILTKNEEEVEGYATTIDEVLERMSEHESDLRRLVGDEDRSQLELYSKKWREWQEIHLQVRHFIDVGANVAARRLSRGDAQEAFERFDALLNQLVMDIHDEGSTANEDSAGGESVQNSALMSGGVAGIRRRGMEMQRAEKNMLLSSTSEAMKKYDDESEPLAASVEQQLIELGKITGKTEDAAFKDVQAAWKDYRALNEEIRRLAHEKATPWAVTLANDMGGPLADECERLVDAIVRKNEENMAELQRSSAALFRSLRNTLIGFSTVGIMLSVAVSYFTGQRIAQSLSSLAKYAQNIHRARDLSKPIPQVSDDEVGQLAAAFDDMRKTVYRQTHELAKLNHSLKHKSDEMEQFVYTVSHDLKSPLVSCKGLLGLLREDIADGNQEEIEGSIRRMGQATDQLSQIIDDLLALSRIGRKSLDLSDVNTTEVITTLREQLSGRIEAIGAEVRVSHSLPNVRGDESDIKRVFENLLTNAIKYAGDGPLIEVGGEEHDGEVRLYVRDNGPGIEPQYHKKVFGLFQRLDASKPGTGLGLASVSKIMRMHGGKVWVESQPQVGATFWLSFPRPKPPIQVGDELYR